MQWELWRFGEAITVAHHTEERHAGLVAFLEEHGPALLVPMGAGRPFSVVVLSA